MVGKTLTAAKGTIADANGVTKADDGDAGYAYTYQWVRVDSDGSSNATDITGATSKTYVLVAADEGKKVKVRVGFQDDLGNAETRTSDAFPSSATIAEADTTGPTVSAIAITSSPPSNQGGHYKADDDLEVTVTFDEAIAVTGAPELKVRVGTGAGSEKAAGCARKGGTGDDAKKLVCTYTVAAGDADTDGVSVEANKLSLPSSPEATIEDANGNDATLTHEALAAQDAHKVDAVAPAAPVSLAAAAGTAKVTLTWSDPSPADASIAKWQVRRKTTGEYGEWADIAGGASARSHEATELDNGTAYTFEVRAVDTATNEGAAGTAGPATPVANSAATGKPAITGTGMVGKTLTAAKGTIADANGVMKADDGDTGYAYTYQWVRVDSDGSSNAADISGATSSTYVLVAADEGKKVKVRVAFRDDLGNAESRTSDAFPSAATIAAAAITPTVPANAVWSATLTVDEGSDGGWLGCGTIQYGVNDLDTCSAALTDDDFDHAGTTYTITIFARYRSGDLQLAFDSVTPATAKKVLGPLTLHVGNKTFAIANSAVGTADSSPVLEWGSAPSWSEGDEVAVALSAPANVAATGAPAISGTATVGETLTAAKGTVADANGVARADAGDAGFAYTYQWVRVDSDGSSNAADISAATSSTYVLAAADEGKKVMVRVGFYDDAGYAESLTSDAWPASETIAAADSTAPTISGIAVTSNPASNQGGHYKADDDHRRHGHLRRGDRRLPARRS